MKKRIFLLLIIVVLFGCTTIGSKEKTDREIMLDFINNHTTYLDNQCHGLANRFPIYFSDWKCNLEPKLREVKKLSQKAREEAWAPDKIRTDIFPNLANAHNTAYKWGVRIVDNCW